MNRLLPVSLLLLIAMVCPAAAADMEITPFRTVNQSPLVQIFGLPTLAEATVAPSGKTVVSLVQDVASDYTVSSNAREFINLDGESYRWTLAARRGFGGRFEAGLGGGHHFMKLRAFLDRPESNSIRHPVQTRDALIAYFQRHKIVHRIAAVNQMPVAA